MTNFFRKIYLSHFIQNGCERVMCERWVGDWTKRATYWPPVPLSLAVLLSRSAWLLNRGSWGPIALCWVLVLSTVSYLQLIDSKLTEPVCRMGLYNWLTSNCFLWASHLHPIQPVQSQGYPLISSTGCTCSLIDGWVGGQYVTSFPPPSLPPLSLSLSLSLSLCFSSTLTLNLSEILPLSVSVFISHEPFSLCLSVSRTLSLNLSQTLPLSVSISLTLSVCLHVCLSLCFSLIIS